MLAGLGAGLGASTLSSYADLRSSCAAAAGGCPDEDRDALDQRGLAVNILFGAAGAAAIASVILYFTVEDSTADSANREPTPASVALVPMPGGAALLLRY